MLIGVPDLRSRIRLLILLTILKVVVFGTLGLGLYNMAYTNGYEHGLIAGFWGFDKPRNVRIEEQKREVFCIKRKISDSNKK